MKYTNILVPYDRSESAKRALSTALEIAADEDGAHVTVFFASPVPEFESAQFLAAENMSGVVRIPPEELAAMQKEYLDYERGLLVDDLKDFVGEAVLFLRRRISDRSGAGQAEQGDHRLRRAQRRRPDRDGLPRLERRRGHARVGELCGVAQRLLPRPYRKVAQRGFAYLLRKAAISSACDDAGPKPSLRSRVRFKKTRCRKGRETRGAGKRCRRIRRKTSAKTANRRASLPYCAHDVRFLFL